jgi:hypothetical protein
VVTNQSDPIGTGFSSSKNVYTTTRHLYVQYVSCLLMHCRHNHETERKTTSKTKPQKKIIYFTIKGHSWLKRNGEIRINELQIFMTAVNVGSVAF